MRVKRKTRSRGFMISPSAIILNFTRGPRFARLPRQPKMGKLGKAGVTVTTALDERHTPVRCLYRCIHRRIAGCRCFDSETYARTRSG
jgi:hypothetical protein